MTEVPEHFFTQSAVIPFRKQGEKFDVLLISSRKKKRWVIPKGVKEPDLTAHDSAAKEALEEAGIRGFVSASPIGSYVYDKWGGTCTVQVHTMEVRETLDEWEESYRDREWVALDEAANRVQENDLKTLIRRLPQFHASLNGA